MQNVLMNEPYVYANYLVNEAVQDLSVNIPNVIEDMKAMTFDDFNDMKRLWLSNMDFIWLIEGHLTEDDALDMVKCTEASIKFNRISYETVGSSRSIVFNERTIYTRRFVNPNDSNPNAYCKSMFQCYGNSSVFTVLMSLLKEKIFNQLRTQEQLGYIVHSGGQKIAKVNHAFIGVQSSTKDADYLEHRINTLLAEIKDNWPYTKKDIKKIVQAKI